MTGEKGPRKPRKGTGKAGLNPPEDQGEAEVIALAGLPVAGERAAVILGLKLTGQWHRRSASSLAAQWRTDDDYVRQLAAQVDAALEQLAGKEPPRRLVMHQLLLALTECDQIGDPSKRVAARAKVCSEISKVTGLVKGTTISLGAPPPPLTDGALR